MKVLLSSPSAKSRKIREGGGGGGILSRARKAQGEQSPFVSVLFLGRSSSEARSGIERKIINTQKKKINKHEHSLANQITLNKK